MLEKQRVMYTPRHPNGTLDRKGKMTAWPLSRLWRDSDPMLFQVTLAAALLATVLGDCGLPPDIQFAAPASVLNETSFKTGTTLKYNCRPGYSRTSSKHQYLICEKGGRWYYITFCVKRQCSNPGELHNGQVIIKTDYSFGSQIEFSCFEGYILIGSTTSHCEIQDKTVAWSDPFPECVIAQCQAPPDISNGKHTGGYEDDYRYGSSVTYSCDKGFSMLGKASISCTVENKTTGVWSPSPPTCKKISCHRPYVKDGKIVTGFGPSYTYKDSVEFDCNKGFNLKGSSLIHCGADNNWNPPPPICELNSCVDLPDIPHASWEIYHYHKPPKGELYDVETVLKYHCYPGYKPAEDKPTTVTCQRNLTWTSYVECQEVCCTEPDLKNGKILQRRKKSVASSCDYFYGDSISYSCFGRERFDASCQRDGTWSPEKPTCEHSCSYPPVVAHGQYKEVGPFYHRNRDIKYECDKGYVLHGQDTLSCSSSRWSPEVPQCKALCLKPEIEHGKLSVDKQQYNESENFTIQCDSGYGVVGSPNITCSDDRTWYPEVPKCEWEVPAGCERVLAGISIMKCLPNVADVKMALEVYKLSLEIERQERERKIRREKSTLDLSL
ncbi:PREDICTED: C4b-binding protein alpha chain isoform X1 [Hipposideros armiger]|uniref:C4b-binding protein alpha chain isoform X1 n=1 Tax=Hipposideros armiger TaxID=186990 RepID=A0A8B7Q8C5_HIPAR|nr:PREDICTED: C4b-binding protein alpha chain isoform X1 [Hipposideros armiger]XP_019484694.1 PREDICTED: C4b-binding protein alpha chain isoform X1 [Hipposideros armiger]XP_019484695.1 PREDICTED: C4b-binding protein alpha chain isoform X1 [Hipposideros armiger]XP_019484696.1 PREDICTED: C4b-binding protein alpha chain isoform X1 [Hipposideros armiger]XP_019484697.1 PREDICTED: C4b-binding protein alpha chain isoform X1 [Hipposideros armiger]XP_019484698.1 PREDICTED: C4b-binding protein alpha cha